MVLLPLVVQTGFYFAIKHHLGEVEKEARTQALAKRTLARINLLLIDFFDYFEQCLSYCMEQTDRARIRLVNKTITSKKMIAAFIAFMEREKLDPEQTERIRRLSMDFITEGEKLKDEFFDAQNPLVVLMFYNKQTGFRRAASAYSQELIRFARQTEARTSPDYNGEQSLSARLGPWLDTAVGLNIALSLMLISFFMKGTVADLRVLKDNARRLSDGQPLRDALKTSDEIGEVDAKFHDMASTLNEAAEKERLMTAMIKSSAERVTALIDSLPQALVTVSDRGMVEAINPQAAELFGFASSDLLGKPADRLLPGLLGKAAGDRSGSPAEALAELVERTRRAPIGLELENADREIIPAEVSFVAFEFAESTKYVAVISDVSEKRRLEMLKRDFYAMVSHDIRAPIMSIQATMQSIESNEAASLSRTSLDALASSRDSAGRLIEMVKRLLDSEKLDLGGVILDYRSVLLADLVAESVETLSSLAEAASVELASEVEDAELSCDRDLIREVLENLLSNAIKFSPAGGRVVVASAVRDDSIELSVSDQGPGIDCEEQEAIFERFHQIRQSDRKSGFGLGLSICKSIVAQHGGTIGVDSEPGSSSRFWFRLPRSRT
ncbi:MAG: PAS domain-containing protein [Candidatus Melainabacteria bacterium]|nr:PAS domain-containing protein [Candidatus Melainabacteria bacterium]